MMRFPLNLIAVFLALIVGCSFHLPNKSNNFSQFHWSVQGGQRVGDIVNQWLNTNQQGNTSLYRIIKLTTPERRRRIIALNLSGVASRYLHETVIEATVFDENSTSFGTLKLFASRQYSEASDGALFLNRLNEEMDRELSNRLIIWIQNSNFNNSASNDNTE